MKVTKTFNKDSEYAGKEWTIDFEMFEGFEDPAEQIEQLVEEYGATVMRNLLVAKIKIAVQSHMGTKIKAANGEITDDELQEAMVGWKPSDVKVRASKSKNENFNKIMLEKMQTLSKEDFEEWLQDQIAKAEEQMG